MKKKDIILDTNDIAIDVNGNEYKTVKIGDQVWMAENLRTTKFRNGDMISNVEVDSLWINYEGSAYCYYENTVDSAMINFQGCLYNLSTVHDSRDICPIGWHIPDTTEWNELINHLGGKEVAGGKMKIIGTDYWYSPNNSATNESGFNGFPVGNRSPIDGVFNPNGYGSHWWAKPKMAPTSGLTYYLKFNSSKIGLGHNGEFTGYSIRCVKD